ncbi:MAG: glycosyl hydrolase, partial [Marinilabiliales bacterium]
GYMMQSSDVADTQHEFKDRLIELMGEDKTDEFFDAWLANHVTRADVDSLAAWGFNSIRLPMHYNLFTLPIEEEPVSGQNTWLNKGFDMVDSLLYWCESNNIYLILDLHAAPGGQGANAAISDYDPSKPSLWESPQNRDKTVALWAMLANRYKDEPWIGCYDLLNEVNWDLPGNTMLRSLYVEITNAIRAVDNNHIIIIEGNWFANDFTGLTPPWDDNMLYSFHKYWNYNDQESVDWIISLRDQHNVPLWMGEGGENSNVWFHDAISILEENDIGWSWWPMKRIETIVGPYSIPFTSGYKNILNYWRNQAPKPTVDEAYDAMMELALNTNSANCHYRKDVHDAQIRQIQTDEIIPFRENNIPGILYMPDYDLGKLNHAYYDIDNVNYSQSTGFFEAWNSGWEYRNDGVDIEPNNDPVNSNGFHIGFIAKDEWTNYTVSVSETGLYSARVRVASTESGGKFHLAVDGEDVTETQTVSSTGSWTGFQDKIITDIVLEEGEHIITLWFDDNKAFNISSIEFTKTGEVEDVLFLALNGNTGDDEKSVEIALNKNIQPESVNQSIENFSLMVGGEERTISSVSAHPNKDRTIIIETEGFLVYTDQIKVSYDGTIITSDSGNILETFSDLTIRNILTPRFILPKKIQAEDYYFMSGFGLEDCSDIGGGKNIGYTNSGDYAEYLIYNNEEKQYQLNLRVAALYGSASITFYLIDENNNETELCQVNTPTTGGWQTWKTISSFVTVPEGVFKLKMYVNYGEFNLNWFEFDTPNDIGEDVNGLNSGVLVYPNPVRNNQLFIKLINSDNTDIQIDFYSPTAKHILTKTCKLNSGTADIDISNIPEGLVIVRVKASEKSFNFKLIKQ